MDTRREVEHFRLFSVFLAAGLVDMSSEFLNFSNVSNTEKKMASRLANSKAENFWVICSLFQVFFLSAVLLPHGQLLAVIEQTF